MQQTASTLNVLVRLIVLLILATVVVHAQEQDSLQYVVLMKNGDSFRGKLIGYTDSTMIVQTEFGRVTIPKDLISSFVAREGPYTRRPHHFLMPTGSPNGPGGFMSNYELGFLYGGFGLGYGATITAGITLVPGIPLKSQLYHVGAKFTIQRDRDLELALGATYTWLTSAYPYSHIYAVGTFPLGSGRYSAMVMYRVTGTDVAPVAVAPFGGDTTRFTIFYSASIGAAFGFDGPAFGRDDIRWVGEIWNNDITKPQNTVSMLGVRVTNETLSADFGVAIFTAPAIFPVTSFSYRF
jgi:hypothetical protein